MKRCIRCVVPDTRPDTHFTDGVCSACVSFDKRKDTDWLVRKAELLNLLDRHDGRCIVPSSGGKDSHAQALMLLELGARPIVVTATTCMLTELGRANIANLARYATTIEVTPNRSVRARLNKLGLQLVGDISWPEHVSIFTTPFRAAVALEIPLIFYGENPQNQYGGPPGADEARQMTRRWVSEFGGFLGLRPADLVGKEGLTERDLTDYMPPPADEIAGLGVEAHFLGQYLPWDSETNAMKAAEHGFVWERPSVANWWGWENLDNAMTGLHDHGGYRKYGMGRSCQQVSVEIRAGRCSRDRAMAWLRNHDGLYPHEYAGVHVSEIADHIGMDVHEINKTLERFTNWDLFARVEDGRPVLKEWA